MVIIFNMKNYFFFFIFKKSRLSKNKFRKYKGIKANYCDKCELWNKPKSHTYHCNKCDVCIEGHKFHFYIAGHCIGKKNIKEFYWFIAITIIFLFYLYFIYHFNKNSENNNNNK